MKLCTYVVTHDTGFAPNPFWGYCTLAACTPNHMGIRLRKWDWIVGTEPAARGSRLVYAMRVSEILPFEAYYSDPRFGKKKPVRTGTWKQRCGDNIYHKDADAKWQQHSSLFHNNRQYRKQDLKHPYVFIAEHFYYFGKQAQELRPQYHSLTLKRQGVKCNHKPEVVNGFLEWLQTNFEPGVHGQPRESSECGG